MWYSLVWWWLPPRRDIIAIWRDATRCNQQIPTIRSGLVQQLVDLPMHCISLSIFLDDHPLNGGGKLFSDKPKRQSVLNFWEVNCLQWFCNLIWSCLVILLGDWNILYHCIQYLSKTTWKELSGCLCILLWNCIFNWYLQHAYCLTFG